MICTDIFPFSSLLKTLKLWNFRFCLSQTLAFFDDSWCKRRRAEAPLFLAAPVVRLRIAASRDGPIKGVSTLRALNTGKLLCELAQASLGCFGPSLLISSQFQNFSSVSRPP